MLLQLFRNKPNGNAITGKLLVSGQPFCNTLERVDYQILPLCYHVAVTKSPKFKRLLPIVQNVPQRSGIRFHRGTRPEHSTGCILLSKEKEIELTELILQAQNAHEEIILEITDFRPGTESGYNTKCPLELQQWEIDTRRAEERYYQLHPEECPN